MSIAAIGIGTVSTKIPCTSIFWWFPLKIPSYSPFFRENFEETDFRCRLLNKMPTTDPNEATFESTVPSHSWHHYLESHVRINENRCIFSAVSVSSIIKYFQDIREPNLKRKKLCVPASVYACFLFLSFDKCESATGGHLYSSRSNARQNWRGVIRDRIWGKLLIMSHVHEAWPTHHNLCSRPCGIFFILSKFVRKPTFRHRPPSFVL